MKILPKHLFFVFIFFLPLLALAQNATPVVTNVVAVADTSNHKVYISFDLADAENDSMEVWIQVSPDSGKTWRVIVDSTTGDKGFPVLQGTGKSITWFYVPAALASYSGGLAGFRVRIIADDLGIVDLNDILVLIDSSRIHSDLLALEGVRHRTGGLAKLNEVADSIEFTMNANNLHPYRQGTNFGGYNCQNITCRKSGTRSDSATWLMSGHFDTVFNSPGADDNGTAVVTVLEAIRVLSGFQTKESIRYLEFDLEEPGLIGSTQYVTSAIPAWENTRGLLNMDAVGYYSNVVNSQTLPVGFNIAFPAAYATVQADSFRGNFIASIVNTASSWLDTVYNQVAAMYCPALKVLTVETAGTGTQTPDLRRSDHAPFWDAGYSALFLSTTANFRNPNYHTANDTVGSINMPFFLENVKAVILTLAKLAQPEHSGIGESNTVQLPLPAARTETEKFILPELAIAPNPNSGKCKAIISLPRQEVIKLEIMDHHGRLISVLKEGRVTQGTHEIEIDLNLAADHYVVKLTTKNGSVMQPLVVLH